MGYYLPSCLVPPACCRIDPIWFPGVVNSPRLVSAGVNGRAGSWRDALHGGKLIRWLFGYFSGTIRIQCWLPCYECIENLLGSTHYCNWRVWPQVFLRPKITHCSIKGGFYRLIPPCKCHITLFQFQPRESISISWSGLFEGRKVWQLVYFIFHSRSMAGCAVE